MGDEPKTVFIELDTASAENPFLAAKRAAEDEADNRSGGSMLISWKNNRTGETSPNVTMCRECHLAGWEMYAASRGADLRIEVNGGEYVFIFKGV